MVFPLEAIIIAIIVGIIGAMANKKKLEKSKSNKPIPNPRSLFGEMQKTIEENIKKLSPEMVSDPAPKMNNDDFVYRDEELDAEIQADRLKIQEEYYEKKLEQINHQVDNIKKREHLSLISDGDDVVKGIILAEILGPPRAKKPYKRN